jgi:hypothetical protein
MKSRRKVALFCICIVLAVTLVGGNVSTKSYQVDAASSTSNITVGKFITLLTKASGTKKSDLVKEGEFTDTSVNITYEDAAVLVDRADTIKNGEKYSKSLYENIVSKKRISDISKASESKRDAIYRCFTKGIMVGKSNGAYSQTRKITPKSYLTLGDANSISDRIKSKSKRIKLSYDGQVVRTTNLPKNYKKYAYILASFPNSFYEPKLMYERIERKTPLVQFVDYSAPKYLDKMECGGEYVGKVVKEDGDAIIENLRTNLMTRFNYNYKTTDTNKWISTLASTYKYYPEDVAKSAKAYVKAATKRKVVVQCSKLVIEPSTAYWSMDSLMFRVHARIKVNASKWATYGSGLQKELIYAVDSTWFKGLKNGKWYDVDFDVFLGGTYGDPVSNFKLNDVFDILSRSGE